MLLLDIKWDSDAERQLAAFATADPMVHQALADIMHEAGNEAVSFIRPLMKGNGYWQPSSGRLASSLHYTVTGSGGDIAVNFYADAQSPDGKFYQQYMDVGNFPANMPLYARNYGMKFFPISARAGSVKFKFPVIHGMGHTSSDSPRHFSDKAADHMEGQIRPIANKHMQELLRKVVVSR